MAKQLREFAKSKDKHLTQFTYTNGKFEKRQKIFYRSAWGNRVRDWRKENRAQRNGEYDLVWVPYKKVQEALQEADKILSA